VPATSCNGTCPDSRRESSEVQGRRLTYPYATLFHVFVSSFRDASIREQVRGRKAAQRISAYTRCTSETFRESSRGQQCLTRSRGLHTLQAVRA
jgi:hypothetical protein